MPLSGPLDDHRPRISKWFEQVDVTWGRGGIVTKSFLIDYFIYLKGMPTYPGLFYASMFRNNVRCTSIFVTFYTRRKYLNKRERRRTRGYTTKHLSLLKTVRDNHLIISKGTVKTLWVPVKIFVQHVSRLIYVCPFVTRVSVLPVSSHPTMHCPWESTSFISLMDNNFYIFLLVYIYTLWLVS